MLIDIIDNVETFREIKKNWNFVYSKDSQAHFFLSWVWLSGWLQMVHEPWFILAAKLNTQDSSYIAFFPLKIVFNRLDGYGFYPAICMAGNSMADYTGLICLPNHEREVIPAFAAYIQQELVWSSFNVQNVLDTDTRMSLFLNNFSQDCFELSQYRIRNKTEDTDHYIAPYISLAENWDLYLQNNVSSNTRQKIRRFLKKIDNSNEFYITYVDAETLESDLDILLGFWEAKWRNKKGDNCDVIINCVRTTLRHCFKNDCLYLSVLWKGDRPLGAIANFIDVRQKSILFTIAGRDCTFKNPPPGLVLHADAIRYATQNGFKVYDFLRGNEPYKYSFGVKERSILHIVAKHKNRQNENAQSLAPPYLANLKSPSRYRQLNFTTLSLLLKFVVKEHQASRLTEAEQGYRQILEIDSNHPEALYGLGVLMRQKAEYPTAKSLFDKLLQVRPNSLKALFGLANLYQTQGRLAEAVEAYKRILAIEPKAIAAYNNLGYVLELQGQLLKAIACYRTTLELDSDCIEAEVNLGNILHSQGKLSPDKQIYYAKLNYKLGLERKKVGDFGTAKVYFQKVLELDPNYGEAQIISEEVYKSQQKLSAAKVADLQQVKVN